MMVWYWQCNIVYDLYAITPKRCVPGPQWRPVSWSRSQTDMALCRLHQRRDMVRRRLHQRTLCVFLCVVMNPHRRPVAGGSTWCPRRGTSDRMCPQTLQTLQQEVTPAINVFGALFYIYIESFSRRFCLSKDKIPQNVSINIQTLLQRSSKKKYIHLSFEMPSYVDEVVRDRARYMYTANPDYKHLYFTLWKYTLMRDLKRSEIFLE